MIVLRRAAILFLLILALARPALAADPSASAAGSASAQIVQAISATALNPLDFGIIAVSPNLGGSAIVRPGERQAIYRGGASATCSGAGQCPMPRPARFRVIGEPGRDYVVSAPSSLAARSDSLGASDLEVTDLRVRSDSRPQAGAAGRLDLSGQDGFEVGGVIVIPAGTPAAHYRATIEVVVGYI